MSTLNENILKVKETFEDIAIAIEEKGVEISPCDSPMVYGDKIRSIVEQVVFDPEKIYAEAHDIDEQQPTVEVIKSDDNGAIFVFGLRRGAPGKDGEDGTPGQDGITPQLKIEDGYWYVSYDNGSTWTRLSKATGEDGAPGQDGQDGENGKDGQDGEQGPQGPQGEQGPEGPQGPQGPKGEDGQFTEEIKQALVTEALNNLQEAYYSKEEIDSLYAALDEAVNNKDTGVIAKAAAALARAEEVNEAISTLQSKFNEDGTIKKDVLNEQDMYDLSIAALGSAAGDLVGQNSLAADDIWAKNLTALIGKFVKIKGDQIEANTLQASQINGVEQLVADKIAATEITTDRLNTRPTQTENTGRILIEDNDIKIYDKDSSAEVVRISGSNVSDYAEAQDIESIGGGISIDQHSADSPVYYGKFCDLSSLVDGQTYKMNGSISFEASIRDTTEKDPNLQYDYNSGSLLIYIVQAPSIVTGQDIETGVYTPICRIAVSNQWMLHERPSALNYGYNVDFNESYGGTFVHKTGYDLYVYCSTNSYMWSNDASVEVKYTGGDNHHFDPHINRTELTSEGLKLIQTLSNCSKFNFDGSFEITCNGGGIRLTSDGKLQYKKNGSWTNLG